MHPTRPIEAGIDSLAWLAGRWLGTDGEDRLEEIWTEPHGGMFRWHRAGTARFYELLSIEPGEAGPVFRIKHFHPGLRGWEEKEDSVTLDLVAISPDEAVFLKRGETRWMVYRLETGGDELVCWFETEEEPHAAGDEFRYRRG